MTPMTVVGLMVTRNEAGRYLQATLTHLVEQVDRVVVYDDQSDDGTADIARSLGCDVVVRDDTTPPFVEHEGLFRAASWAAVARFAGDGDFVVSIDADEMLVATSTQMGMLIQEMTEVGSCSAIIQIDELWELRPPMVRKDRYWGSIRDTRIIRWEDGAEFADRKMGCGSAPTFVQGRPVTSVIGDVSIVHLGHVDPDDRQAKHDLYMQSVGPPVGHDATHVASILGMPVLRPWQGPPLDVWRGCR